MAEICSDNSSPSQNSIPNTTPDPTQNPASIYYLHPSDHTSTKLVSNPFDGTGYGDWKRSVIIGLTAKNKMDFITDTLPKPTYDDILERAWERCNNMVIGWLIASLDRTLAKSIMYFSTASEIWKDLEDRFGQSSYSQLYALQEELASLTQTNGLTVAEYFTKVKSLWDELDNLSPIPTCSCNHCSCNLTKAVLKLQQEGRIMHFLMNLDPKYNQVRTNILMMNELPSASLIYRLLQQEERHKEVSKLNLTPTESLAFAIDRKKYYHKPSDYSPQERSMAGTKRTAPYFCDHCKIPGHSVERCFKLHGYPPNTRRSSHKRVAAVTQSTPTDPLIFVKETGLTTEQFNHLLTLLGKKDVETNTDADNSTNIAGNIAGPYNEEGPTSW